MPVTPDALAHAEDLADFVAASPSSYHAAAEVARRLEDAGFEPLAEEDAWDVTPGGRYLVVRDGAAIAWTVPADATAVTPAHVLGAHTDSPGFKLKPQPTTGSKGWLQVAVEVYGGPLLNSWLDRELRLAGRLALADGRVVLADTGALLRLPQLAVHLDREANSGLALDKQFQTQPVWGLGDPTQEDILAELADSAGVSASEIRGYDVVIADSARGAVFGKDDAFFASGRLDDLASVHAGVVALEALGTPATGPIAILAAFDHEELGSNSRSGAAGPFLEDILGRVYDALGADSSERRRAFAASWCLSSDVGHSVHPNYVHKHDPVVQPVLGSGPILKLNSNQRYATDAVGSAAWRNWCEAADVVTQEFVSNNNVRCGSTIGPITATRLGIRTVDVGIPILSMHSARELAGVSDLHDLARVAGAFFAG
ncbi:aspartyl aminopeptidase [Microbacterium phyllosphaerae]|uniref:M18 family aminopeptidase n=1 Tax=Microbacterium phyllosphaerae TaxID=124798 RepID=A0ABS4WUD0_9MICO|nr:M18 family aminopeptidase [Microbacterium phyllosphaerae]MBP2379822.1 aspartyl aminopeptidase [Microbacterium phyllosphaerae]